MGKGRGRKRKKGSLEQPGPTKKSLPSAKTRRETRASSRAKDPSASDGATREGAGASGAPDLPVEGERRWILLGLGAFVCLQLLVPLGYYVRDDPYDERFAWRMFSAVRLFHCNTEVTEGEDLSGHDGRRVTLGGHLHAGWRTQLRRNRRRVIERFLESRCAKDEDLGWVMVTNKCLAVDGTRLAPQAYRLTCESHELEAPSGPPAPLREEETQR